VMRAVLQTNAADADMEAEKPVGEAVEAEDSVGDSASSADDAIVVPFPEEVSDLHDVNFSAAEKDSSDVHDRDLAEVEEDEEWQGPRPVRRKRTLGMPTRVTFLLEAAGLEKQSAGSSIAGAIYGGLGPATFQDRRWENAMDYLRECGVLGSRERVHDLLRRGAQAFGLWCVSDLALDALARHVLEQPGVIQNDEMKVSAALQGWLEEHQLEHHNTKNTAEKTRQHRLAAPSIVSRARRSASITSGTMEEFVSKSRRVIAPSMRARRLKAVLFALVIFISGAIAIPWRPTPTSRTFGGGLVIARITGIGTLLWTALLFLSMSRTMIKGLYWCLPSRSLATRQLDANETTHVFCGKMIFLFGVVHTLAHLVCTYRVMEETAYQKLNEMLNCATKANMPLVFLQWPSCPLQRQHGYYELVLSMTGITGFLLLVVVLALGYTAAKRVRKANYEIFWYTHNVCMVLFLVLLFLHGSQGWFGIGVPLVLPLCTLPVCLYSIDRVLRVVRFYMFRDGSVRILSAVIRPGPKGDVGGALTALQVTKPPRLWNFRAGMYAYLNVPEYSSGQWHPFTIVSGREDDTVDFIVAGVGDWTKALAQQCLDYKNELRPDFPKIAMDGPYAAPVTTALCCQVLVAIGAGVGITPFLALMARIVAMLGEDGDMDGNCNDMSLQEVHFFWITRSADEFLFGRYHFTRIVSNPVLREKVFLHLHLTQREPAGDASAFLFREAVRRQSRIDRQAFLPIAIDLAAQEGIASGQQVPSCWAHGADRHDVFWVSSLIEGDDAGEEEELAQAFDNHWAEGAACMTAVKSGGTEPLRQKHPGPLLCRRMSSTSSASAAGLRCSSRSSSTASEIRSEQVIDMAPSGFRQGTGTMLPVAFGRPDFYTEIQAIGKAWPEYDVDVFACGNNALVDSLRDICRLCTSRAALHATSPGFMGYHAERTQRYNIRCENFGDT